MQAEYKEVKFDVCFKHKDTYFGDFYPGYLFNYYLLFPARKCRIVDCEDAAYYTIIGVKVPDAVGEIKRDTQHCRATLEVFQEAKKLLDGGLALEQLTHFLMTRIVPSKHRKFLAQKLIRKYAMLVLDKLKIDHNQSLSDQDKHRILLELSLYPEEFE